MHPKGYANAMFDLWRQFERPEVCTSDTSDAEGLSSDSDDEDLDTAVDPRVCPYCKRSSVSVE